MNEDLKVRRAVCEAHGLAWSAANLLVGETIPELEESATQLAELLSGSQPEPVPTRPAGMFEVAAAEKAERKQALVDALCGRFPPARDEQGRYASAEQ